MGSLPAGEVGDLGGQRVAYCPAVHRGEGLPAYLGSTVIVPVAQTVAHTENPREPAFLEEHKGTSPISCGR
jgi:hypothetical protein